ncbi:hypothetical protein BDK51DRAFT_33386 [Blyttiomyces helicus]|uniref:Uncharacterized protein n=1 Tax=Blyttiomyces helicus TaxID=388810 RepID=A0A4P9WDI4_9FUNG|nr:hypothetical protein BDK51DRAFT_33386 [Blyttiomyces helicus]|eukprot:RKO89288.1 hypothetical protein BDK51DRAFT_33386 [Blyttiomyces helicus]
MAKERDPRPPFSTPSSRTPTSKFNKKEPMLMVESVPIKSNEHVGTLHGGTNRTRSSLMVNAHPTLLLEAEHGFKRVEGKSHSATVDRNRLERPKRQTFEAYWSVNSPSRYHEPSGCKKSINEDHSGSTRLRRWKTKGNPRCHNYGGAPSRRKQKDGRTEDSVQRSMGKAGMDESDTRDERVLMESKVPLSIHKINSKEGINKRGLDEGRPPFDSGEEEEKEPRKTPTSNIERKFVPGTQQERTWKFALWILTGSDTVAHGDYEDSLPQQRRVSPHPPKTKDGLCGTLSSNKTAPRTAQHIENEKR